MILLCCSKCGLNFMSVALRSFCENCSVEIANSERCKEVETLKRRVAELELVLKENDVPMSLWRDEVL